MNSTLSKKRRIQPVSEQTMLKLKTGYVQVCTAARLYLFKYCQSVSHSLTQFVCLSVSLSVYLSICWSVFCFQILPFAHTYFVSKCHSKILPKILVIVVSSNVVMVMVLKCRRKRGVTGFRPPPGGPIAPIIWMSTK